ncbi:hypothetical protein IBE10_09310, partial [Francisella tularensis subsp. novicida]|nr:hypothetical protein [Francisella tularensis subsp. novicida]
EILSGQGTNLLVVKVPGYSKDKPKGEFSVVATDSEGIESNTATKEVAVSEDTASSFKPGMPTIAGMDNVVEFNDLTLTATAD